MLTPVIGFLCLALKRAGFPRRGLAATWERCFGVFPV